MSWDDPELVARTIVEATEPREPNRSADPVAPA
jgi:hypothetical protein